MKLGFMGAAGSGKTTMARALAKDNGFVLAFADALRFEIVDMINKIDQKNFITLNDLRNPATKGRFRLLMQAWGDYRRWDNPNYWNDHMVKRLANMGDNNVFVDDIRYKNEYELLVGLGFQIVRLEDSPITILDALQASHSSENEWRTLPCDYTLPWQPNVETRVARLKQMVG